LYRGAISESGSPAIFTQFQAGLLLEQAELFTECPFSLFDCLALAPDDDLLYLQFNIQIEPPVYVFPSIDGVLIKDQPWHYFKDHSLDVHVIIGDSVNEWADFYEDFFDGVCYDIYSLNADEVVEFVDAYYGERLQNTIQSLYDWTTLASPSFDLYQLTVDIGNDNDWLCPNLYIASHIKDSYVYEFTATPSQDPCWGASHFLETFYLYNTEYYEFCGLFTDLFDEYGIPTTFPSAQDLALQNQMIKYWSDFVKHKDPNSSGSPKWPTYKKEQNINLGYTIDYTTGYHKEQCDLLWNDFFKIQHPSPL